MSKKIFAFLMVAVFVLAQFGAASAATVAGDVTVDALPTFSRDWGIDIDIDIEVINMNPGNKYIYVWFRQNDGGANNLWLAADCEQVAGFPFTGATFSGTHTFADNTLYDDGDTVEFYVTVDSVNSATCAGAVTPPATAADAMTSTFIDGHNLEAFIANPPSLEQDWFNSLEVACNTFEMWGLLNDYTSSNYSGLDDWNTEWAGTVVAPPAPEGAGEDLLSWIYTFPTGAVTGSEFNFWVNPLDVAGNGTNFWNFWNGQWFRDDTSSAEVLNTAEKADCEDFSDVAGHENEAYIRYLADLGLLAGNPDGSFAPDNTLTRAEASVLFETANGYDAASLPTSAPAGCDFPDVAAATDWFAGWVWQACADGFMNGQADGNFGPANLLTRGQIVTVFNNMTAGFGNDETFLDDGTHIGTTLNQLWGVECYREAAWTDVALGAYYAAGVVNSYCVGITEGTSANAFSPDSPISRGLFAKWLYRTISRVW